MNKNYLNKLEELYRKTNRGLDIIFLYYPQARENYQKKKLFKIRPDEKTPSASIKEIKNVWRVTDFGDDSTAMSPIDICMREENISFSEALAKLCDIFSVNNKLNSNINKPHIEQRPMGQGDSNRDFDFIAKEKMTDEELFLLGPPVNQKTVDKYNYVSLKSYSIYKNAKKTIISANSNYPIFMRDCGDFKKIYQPLNPDKAFRFFYVGIKPPDYINGFSQLKEAHEKFIADQAPDPEDPKQNIPGKDKLPETIICTGERDALCVAGHGYLPIWLNSESNIINDKQYKEISKLVEKIYYLPNIDDTGIRQSRKLAMKFIDIYTISLPDWLKKYRDYRGKPRNDFRDFCEINPSLNGFRDLIKMAKTCRFWDKLMVKDGFRFEINTINLIQFLSINGFNTFVDRKTKKISYIKISDFLVSDVIGKQIRAFIKKFLEENYIDHEIQNLVLNSKRTGISVMDDLPEAHLEFSNCDVHSQMIFFKNKALRVFKDKIEEIHNKNITNYVWDTDIAEHNFNRISSAFSVSISDNKIKDFHINHKKSHFFRFLINASRIYWREEFELISSEDPLKNKEYIEKHKFDIDGPRLLTSQKDEQKMNLLNKLWAIGYLMHKWKFDSKSMGIWMMENKITEETESSGGSGKSFMIKFLHKSKIKRVINLDGRNRKLTDNPHMLENVNEYTDILNIDDAHQYFDFDSFYSLITGNMNVNQKHTKSKELDFSESPKIAITSNFPPPKDDSSTLRRLLLVVFSDYYHKKTDNNDYNEDRTIADDFGYDLHDPLFSENAWNEDYNFLIDCLQFYLTCVPHSIVVRAPLENVRKRIHLSKMGQQFFDWAQVYFSPRAENINTFVKKKEALEDFQNTSKLKLWSSHKFTKALKAFCQFSDYIESLNPDELRDNNGRIIKRIDGSTHECIYLKTYDKEIIENI